MQSPQSSFVSASVVILACPDRWFWLHSNCKICALRNGTLQCSPAVLQVIYRKRDNKHRACVPQSNFWITPNWSSKQPRQDAQHYCPHFQKKWIGHCSALHRAVVKRIWTGDGNSFSLSKGNSSEKCFSKSEYLHLQLFSGVVVSEIPHFIFFSNPYYCAFSLSNWIYTQ